MKNITDMSLAEVTLEILKAAVNIPDGMYARAQFLAKKELRIQQGAQHAVCSNGILCHNSNCQECGGNGAYKPAAQPQGEPVALTNAQRRAADYKEQQAFNDWAFNKSGEAIGRMDGNAAATEAWHARAKLYAEQPAPVAENHCVLHRGEPCQCITHKPATVAVVLAEARTWLGDGLNSDGLAQEYWTPEYAALIERIDATLRNTK